MIPVPGYRVTTPYGIKGPYWKACGFHTGADFAAPKGTPVVAARPGTLRHRNYGSAFGPFQFAIVCADGTEDFYAHTLDRPKDGTKVGIGATVARVGDLGNVTGPHLHFERHAVAGRWVCSLMQDPKRSIEYGEDSTMVEYHYGGKPDGTQVVRKADKYVRVDRSRWNPVTKGLEHAILYLNVSGMKFEAGKSFGLLRVRAVRERTNDKTSYHDYVIVAGVSEQLITHPYFEDGDGGATRYEVKVHSGLTEVTLGTRYRKGAVVR